MPATPDAVAHPEHSSSATSSPPGSRAWAWPTSSRPPACRPTSGTPWASPGATGDTGDAAVRRADRRAGRAPPVRRRRPEPRRPGGLVRLRREGRARARSCRRRWYDYAEVGRLRGVSENAARFALHKAADRRAVLLVQNDAATLVPPSSSTRTGQVRQELLTVLEPLLAARIDPWRTWIWLTSPAALLGGAVPHEAARDADELPLVQRAAVALAERAQAARR